MSKVEKVEEMKINDSKFTINIEEAEKPSVKKIKYRDETKPTIKKKQKEEKTEEKDDLPTENKDVFATENKDNEIPELDYEKDDIEAKRKRLMIISRYKNSKRFGSWLKTQGFEFNTKQLKDKSLDELENMINDIRFCISTKNTNNMYETGATKGVIVLENMLRPVYKVDGLSQVLSSDPMYLDLIEELLLERANYVYVKPEYRLLYCVLSSAYIVHAQHIALEKLSQTEEGKKMISDFANKIKENETMDKLIKDVDNHLQRNAESTNTPHIITTRMPMIPEKKQLDDQYLDRYKDLFNQS
jgi:hypothetical protein